MSYGEIYKSTWWGTGVPNSIYWGSVYSDLASTFNTKAVQFDGVSPAESIFISDIGYQFLEAEGMLIMAWVKIDDVLKTFNNFGQRCIIDYSSSITSTSSGKGYSIYVRKTTTTLTINWFYKRVGLTRSQCNVDIDLNQFDFSKPMLLVASLYPDNIQGVPSTHQDFRIYQSGVNSNDYVDGTSNIQTQLGSTFPSSQNVCIGNTSDTGTVSSEFAGIVDEVVIYSQDDGDIGEDYRQISDDYFRGDNGDAQLDISQLPFYNLVRGWYRMGDNFNGTQFVNASGGSGANATPDIDFSESQIVNNII